MSRHKALFISLSIRIFAIMICLSMVYGRFIFGALPENRYLLRAIAQGDVEKVTLVYGRSWQSIDEVDVDGNGPLHMACQCADTQSEPVILWYLLDNGANARMLNTFKETPIHKVIHISNVQKRVRYINYLVKHGTLINARGNDNNTILDKAVIERNQDACAMILDWFNGLLTRDTIEHAKKMAGSQAGKGFGFTEIYAEIDKKRGMVIDAQGYAINGMTPLMMAVIRDDKKSVIDLLDRKADIQAQSQDRWGYSALDIAIMHQNVGLVELLVAKGASTAQKNKMLQYPLWRVCEVANKSQRMRMVNVLMGKQVPINDVDSQGDTLLHNAVRRKDVDLIEALVDVYALTLNVNIKNAQGLSVLDIVDKEKLTRIHDILKPLIKNR